MIHYWLKGESSRNFGDELTLPLSNLFEPMFLGFMQETQDFRFHLIGSVLDDFWIDEAKNCGQTPVFWGCGYRGQRMRADLKDIRICGVRGRDTCEALGSVVPAVGDTGLLLPLLYPVSPRRTTGAIVIPHFLDPLLRSGEAQELHALSRQDVKVVSPEIGSSSPIFDLLECIVKSDFVLAGAMHAAVIALAYNIPFAFYASATTAHIDCPPKWSDLCSMHGFTPSFFCDVASGRKWYEGIKSSIVHPPLSGILRAAPGPVLEKYIDQSLRIDIGRRAENLGQSPAMM